MRLTHWLLCILTVAPLAVFAGCFHKGEKWDSERIDLRHQALRGIASQCEAWGNRDWKQQEAKSACFNIGRNTRVNLRLTRTGMDAFVSQAMCRSELSQWVTDCRRGGRSHRGSLYFESKADCNKGWCPR
ncbi:hypothetical protein FDECE_4035 [Fusarium decemcellulare]|nr:hypothetical protein FDECE_4035 [Fusarium decemcellulare]